jgi:hypothetical protein
VFHSIAGLKSFAVNLHHATKGHRNLQIWSPRRRLDHGGRLTAPSKNLGSCPYSQTPAQHTVPPLFPNSSNTPCRPNDYTMQPSRTLQRVGLCLRGINQHQIIHAQGLPGTTTNIVISSSRVRQPTLSLLARNGITVLTPMPRRLHLAARFDNGEEGEMEGGAPLVMDMVSPRPHGSNTRVTI